MRLFAEGPRRQKLFCQTEKLLCPSQTDSSIRVRRIRTRCRLRCRNCLCSLKVPSAQDPSREPGLKLNEKGRVLCRIKTKGLGQVWAYKFPYVSIHICICTNILQVCIQIMRMYIFVNIFITRMYMYKHIHVNTHIQTYR